MKNKVFKSNEFRKYLPEFEFFDGDEFVKFNILENNAERMEITVAVTDRGKISVTTYELRTSGKRTYFEYGVMYERVNIDEFYDMEVLI